MCSWVDSAEEGELKEKFEEDQKKKLEKNSKKDKVSWSDAPK